MIDQKQGLDTNPELTPKHPEQKIKKPQIWDGSLPKPVPQPIIPSTPKQNFIYETLATRRREEQRREMTPEMKRTERAFQMDILKNADFTPFKEDNPNDQPGTVGNPRWEKNERLRKEGIAAANAEAQDKGVLTSELKADFMPFKEDNPNNQPGTVGNPRWEKNERLRKEGIAAANAEAQTKGVLTSELK